MITPPAPAYGDTISGTNLAGGIAAALFARERTGEPSVVDVSLLGSGLWSMGMAVDSSMQAGKPWQAAPTGAMAGLNPLVNLYRTVDERYISLVMLQPMRYWAEFCGAINRPELADDARFNTMEALDANAAEAVDIIRAEIGAQPLSHWVTAFAAISGPWAPVQDTLQAAADPRSAPTATSRRSKPSTAPSSSWWPAPCSSTAPTRSCAAHRASPSTPTTCCRRWDSTSTRFCNSRSTAPLRDKGRLS